jgi:hypothetical protein
MGNCVTKRVCLEVDEDSYDDALDEVLEQIRTQIAMQRGQRLDIRIKAGKKNN